MLTTDARGHRFPSQRTLSKEPVSIVDADIYGTLEPLNIHGPLFTSYLLEFGAFYRDTARYTRDRLGWFNNSTNISFEGKPVGGPILDRPPQQFPEPPHTPKRRQHLIHANNARADAILKAAGRYHPIKHGGWWEHQVANSCISASLHLSALHDERRFFTSDEITADIGIKVPFEIADKLYESIRLVPDYLFGVDRYYAVETDLGNEVGRAEQPHLRKTYERMVLQYLALIGDKLYHKVYGIPDNKALMVLFVTTDAAKIKLMESIIKENVGACNFILMKHVSAEAFSAYHSPKPLYTLWTEPWKRAGRGDFYINNPARQ
jgi:hypothetical protein